MREYSPLRCASSASCPAASESSARSPKPLLQRRCNGIRAMDSPRSLWTSCGSTLTFTYGEYSTRPKTTYRVDSLAMKLKESLVRILYTRTPSATPHTFLFPPILNTGDSTTLSQSCTISVLSLDSRTSSAPRPIISPSYPATASPSPSFRSLTPLSAAT